MTLGVATTDLDAAALTASCERLFSLLRRLTPSDGTSLTAASALHRLDRDGPHRVTDLAAAEGVSQPGMTQLLARLERDRLVERRPDATDRRAVALDITDAGRELVRRRREGRAARFAELLSALPVQEQDEIVAALAVLDRITELA